ncbi:MAG: ISKra4 family transposase [Bifidobacteriaceae bacterium]|nr:ISKra4 family transposase [Bifidobacteriaceae bacterium]
MAGFIVAARAACDREAMVLDAFEDAARRAADRVGCGLTGGAANLVCASVPLVVPCPQGHGTPAHSTRPKAISTMAGDIKIKRAYHYCRACRDGFFPADRLLGVEARTTSTAFDRAVTAAAREVSFARAAQLVEEITGRHAPSVSRCERIAKRSGRAARALIEADTARAVCAKPGALRRCWDPGATAYVLIDGTGLPMVPSETAGRQGKQPDGTGKTREVKIARLATQTGCDKHGQPVLDKHSTSYVATFDPAAVFTTDVAAEAVRRDLAHAPRLAVIADGATWIWCLADKLWPNATQIVDYFHAAEHVCDLADLLKPHLPADQDPVTFTQLLTDNLKAGRIQQLANHARAIALPDQATKDKVAAAVAYFTKNWHRMQYAQFKQDGFFIGSGAVESSCKSLAEARAAQSGMRWTIKGADPIIALRALHRSDNQGDNRYNRIWDRTTPKTTPATATHQHS